MASPPPPPKCNPDYYKQQTSRIDGKLLPTYFPAQGTVTPIVRLEATPVSVSLKGCRGIQWIGKVFELLVFTLKGVSPTSSVKHKEWSLQEHL